MMCRICVGLISILAFCYGYSQSILLDESFGTDGQTQVLCPNDVVTNTITDVAVQSDGRIITCGSGFASSLNDSYPILTRLTLDGVIDSTFGHGGYSVVTDTGYIYQIRAIAIDANDRILVTGERHGNGSVTGVVIRHNSDGSIDSLFASEGILHYSDNDGPPWCNDIKLLSDGRIIVLISGRHAATLLCLKEDGSIDQSFGNNGVFKYTYQGLPTAPWKLGIDQFDRILVAGSIGDIFNTSQMLCSRILPTGNLDTDFGTGGHFNKDNIDDSTFGTSNHGEALVDISISKTGRVILTGSYVDYQTNNRKNQIYSLNDFGQLNFDFGLSGVLDFEVLGTDTNQALYRGVIVDDQENIIATGQHGGNSQDQFFVMACDSSGNSIDAIDEVVYHNFAFSGSQAVNSIYHGFVQQGSGRFIATSKQINGNPGLIGFLPNFTTSIPVAQEQNVIETILYPNPATSHFRVTGEGVEQVILLDAMGRLIVSYGVQDQYAIPQGTAPGSYFARVKLNGNVQTFPLLVE